MKKYILVASLMIAATAYASIETSAMYQEYVRRESVKFTGYERSILSRLQLSGVKSIQIVEFTADEATQTFQFTNNSDEICKGQLIEKKVSYTCESKWAGETAKMLAAIHHSMPKEKIVDIDIFPESKKYVFQTIDREICHGDYYFGKAQFTCFTKAGVMSFFAGGDSD